MTRNGQSLEVSRVETVPEEATVRHVDQLSPPAREALRRMRAGESARAPGLTPGEVVVSTSYLRVVRAEAGPETPAGTPGRRGPESAAEARSGGDAGAAGGR